jgi:hypothetical protein
MDMLKDRRMKMQPVADAPAELPESSEKHKAESNTDDVVISLDYSASDSPSIKKESNEPAESPIEPGELKEESGTITQKVDTDSSAMSRFSAFKDVPFHDAVPSPTHMVIYGTVNILCCSQPTGSQTSHQPHRIDSKKEGQVSHYSKRGRASPQIRH